MSTSLIRPLRRLITKKFGGYKKLFIVISSIGLIFYIVRALFIGDGRQVWDVQSTAANRSNQCDVQCLPEQLSFYIRTGEKTSDAGPGPVICFQGTMYMSSEQGNVGRGLNVVLVDSKSLTVKGVHVFDTYTDETALLRFLKKDTKDDDILLLATFDDASYGLKDSGRHWLSLFGSSLVMHLGFRENFILIGHRGLAKGSAIEYYVAKKDKTDSFAPPIEKAGCFSFPLGKKVSMENTVPDVFQGMEIKVGEHHDNCGVTEACPAGTVSVSVDTGMGNSKQPSVCVDSFVRLSDKTNDAGRGFNIVVLDKDTLQPSKVSHMDTYTFDSTDLELFLESLHPGEIIIAVIADDASKKLGQSARDLLNKMGSGHIQNLRFRDIWYFVGQKGIDGFTKFEQMSFAAFDGGWPKPLSARFCVPKMVPTTQIMIEPESPRNDERRQFCLKYDGYTDFCNPASVDEKLQTIPVFSKELQGHKIFDTPIIIVPGLNHNAFVQTLQTTLMQPGLIADNVAVFWDEKLPEYGELASLFGFRNYSLDSSISYSDQMVKALKFANMVYSSAQEMIFIEEDLLLAPDFMPFMANCHTVIRTDSTLAGAFAWNINGFESASGNSSHVYRVQEFPGLGFLIKSSLLEKLVNSFGNCCKNRAWMGWHLSVSGLEMLMPDVSRAYRTPFYGAEAFSDVSRNLFLKPRRTYLDVEPPVLDLKHLMVSQYEDFLTDQIRSSQVFKPSELIACVRGKAPPPDFTSLDQQPVVIYFFQNSANDNKLLIKLSQCFGLVILDNTQPKNLHNGLLRFYYQQHDVFLIGTMTRYFDQQILADQVFSPSHLDTQQA